MLLIATQYNVINALNLIFQSYLSQISFAPPYNQTFSHVTCENQWSLGSLTSYGYDQPLPYSKATEQLYYSETDSILLLSGSDQLEKCCLTHIPGRF